MDDESQNAQDARVEALWKSLHEGPIIPLDLDGLRAGLKKIGHPLGNADKLLRQVFVAVDTSGDGKIEYSEFRTFIEHTEIELWNLFKNIDKDHNGRLDKSELYAAFKSADIAADRDKLDRFFDHIDANHDGEITFEEWRNFLMFLPLDAPNLGTVISFYETYDFIGSPEGDVTFQGNQGLGIIILYTLFGSIFELAHFRPPPSQAQSSSFSTISLSEGLLFDRSNIPWDPGESATAEMAWKYDENRSADAEQIPLKEMTVKQLLIASLPGSGYFVAGAIAGMTSRTATAPLDRLKVYFIAQTSIKQEAVAAFSSSGSATATARAATSPFINACIELWRMGGIKSLFAGNGLNVLKVAPESAIRFGAFEATKRFSALAEGHGNIEEISILSKIVSGGAAGSLAQAVVYPLDTLKFRVQCETYAGGPRGNALIIQTAQKMMGEGALRSFYRGLTLGVIGMFPYSAVDLFLYDTFKSRYIADRIAKTGCTKEEAKAPALYSAAFGALSSSTGASLVYPINLIRTRMQSQGTKIHPPTYDGWHDCINKTLKHEGWRGLYKGLSPNLLKVVPSMSISYMAYEMSKSLMHLE